jgi:hypothetical protein
MDTWFEIVLTIYGFIYLIIRIGELKSEDDEVPELSEEMRHKLYS